MKLPESPLKLIRWRVNYMFATLPTLFKTDLGKMFDTFVNGTMRCVDEGYIVRDNSEPWALAIGSRYLQTIPVIYLFPRNVAVYLRSFSPNPERIKLERRVGNYGTACFWRWITRETNRYYLDLDRMPPRIFEVYYGGDLWDVYNMKTGILSFLIDDIATHVVPNYALVRDFRSKLNRALKLYKHEIKKEWLPTYLPKVEKALNIIMKRGIVPIIPAGLNIVDKLNLLHKVKEELGEEELKKMGINFDEIKEEEVRMLLEIEKIPVVREAIELTLDETRNEMQSKLEKVYGKDFNIRFLESVFPMGKFYKGVKPEALPVSRTPKKEGYELIFSEKQVVFKITFPSIDTEHLTMQYKPRGWLSVLILKPKVTEKEIWGIEPVKKVEKKLMEAYFKVFRKGIPEAKLYQVKAVSEKLAKETTDLLDAELIEKYANELPEHLKEYLIQRLSIETFESLSYRSGVDVLNWLLASPRGRVYVLDELLEDLRLTSRSLVREFKNINLFEEQILLTHDKVLKDVFGYTPPELGGSVGISEIDLKEVSTIWLEGISFIEITGQSYLFNRVDFKTGEHTIYGMTEGPMRIYVKKK